MEDDEKQAAALSQKIAECSRNSSSFITSGNAAPFRNVPKPVVEDDPRATILNAPPARSFAFVNARGASSDSPAANSRHASAGLRDVGRFWAAP